MIHLNPAVTQALASFWCPTDRAHFITTLFGLAAPFCIVGLVLIRMGSVEGRIVRIAGTALILFALGAAALELLGLSGCGNHVTF